MNKRILAWIVAVGLMLFTQGTALASTWTAGASQPARSTVSLRTSLSGEVVRQVNQERVRRGGGTE